MKQLELSFGNPFKFQEFLDWYLYRAGSSWNADQVKHDGKGNYVIDGTPNELYMLGYDWALWQFPPKK